MLRYLAKLVVIMSFIGCGQYNDEEPLRTGTLALTSGKSLKLKALSAVYLAYERDSTDPTILRPIDRQLGLDQYDVNAVGEIASDGRTALSVVTGMELNASADVKFALIARKFNSQSGQLEGESRLFTVTPGEDLSTAMEFSFGSSSQVALTGLSIRAVRASITKIQLQRKDLKYINGPVTGFVVPGANSIQVDAGYVVTGFKIRFPNADPATTPFISDVRLDSALFTVE